MLCRLRSGIPLLAGAAALVLAIGTRAENLQIPVGAQGSDIYVEIEQLRGLKKDEVSARLGDPLDVYGPVGDPAITRWEYPDFYVYFEWDLVLHTVKKHRG